ncbi:MAG: 30S ribosomal protein S1 [Anaerolineae bacterium]|nr:30S ribosomal protein S1 [Anaerolineae bacterium]
MEMGVSGSSAQVKPGEIKAKMHFTGKVAKISIAGALIDIGIDQPAVLHISQIPVQAESETPKRVEDVLQVGQTVDVWVKKVKQDHIELTMQKPLGYEWRDLKAGMVVKGTVVRMEPFGVFVEIGAERPGLVHISEMSHGYVRQPSDVVKEGDEIEAEILEVNRHKKQIKLSMKAILPEPEAEEKEETPKVVEQKDRRARGKKSGRKGEYPQTESHREKEHTADEAEEVEPDPTVMELAWREAMARKKEKRSENKAKKVKSLPQEHEEILARTLETKINA